MQPTHSCRTRSGFRLRPPVLLLLAMLGAGTLQAAEEEDVVLTITGNLIGPIETLAEDASPLRIIYSYYALLPDEPHAELDRLRLALSNRIPDYEVANRAADTAELNEVVDDLGFYWASIRSIHAREFTAGVAETLNQAYGELYPVIALSH